MVHAIKHPYQRDSVLVCETYVKYTSFIFIFIFSKYLRRGIYVGKIHFSFNLVYNIQGEAHNVLQSDSTQTLIISKNVSNKSFSVREGRHARPPYFLISGGA